MSYQNPTKLLFIFQHFEGLFTKQLLAQELLTSWLDQHLRFADMKENLGSIAVFTYFCGLLVAGLFQGF